MDKLLRIEIINEVKRSMQEALEVANERWIYGEEYRSSSRCSVHLG